MRIRLTATVKGDWDSLRYVLVEAFYARLQEYPAVSEKEGGLVSAVLEFDLDAAGVTEFVTEMRMIREEILLRLPGLRENDFDISWIDLEAEREERLRSVG